MIGYKFGSDQEYLHWCAAMVNKIYYAGICMNDEKLKKVTSEISSKLHVSEGYDLIKIDDTEYEDDE